VWCSVSPFLELLVDNQLIRGHIERLGEISEPGGRNLLISAEPIVNNRFKDRKLLRNPAWNGFAIHFV
jgi:hypothetical protein